MPKVKKQSKAMSVRVQEELFDDPHESYSYHPNVYEYTRPDLRLFLLERDTILMGNTVSVDTYRRHIDFLEGVITYFNKLGVESDPRVITSPDPLNKQFVSYEEFQDLEKELSKEREEYDDLQNRFDELNANQRSIVFNAVDTERMLERLTDVVEDLFRTMDIGNIEEGSDYSYKLDNILDDFEMKPMLSDLPNFKRNAFYRVAQNLNNTITSLKTLMNHLEVK